MNRITLATALTAATLTLTPTPAQAATAIRCQPAAATQLEVDRLAIGMTESEVARIIGSPGVRDPEASTPARLVRQWSFCDPAGVIVNQRQGVAFERAIGYWVVEEIL